MIPHQNHDLLYSPYKLYYHNNQFIITGSHNLLVYL